MQIIILINQFKIKIMNKLINFLSFSIAIFQYGKIILVFRLYTLTQLLKRIKMVLHIIFIVHVI